VAADIPGRSWSLGKKCELLTWTKTASGVQNVAHMVDAFNVYVSYANFTGQGQKPAPRRNVAVSTDCGKTFSKPIKLSTNTQADQGTGCRDRSVVGRSLTWFWRNFESTGSIYFAKSTDGGKTWSAATQIAKKYNPYDQGATNVSMRTLGFPTIGRFGRREPEPHSRGLGPAEGRAEFDGAVCLSFHGPSRGLRRAHRHVRRRSMAARTGPLPRRSARLRLVTTRRISPWGAATRSSPR
jgi:hypothetical protein